MLQSDRSQSEGLYTVDSNHMTPGKRKAMETVKRSVVAKGWERGEDK